jgi:hypothetical protein
MDTSSTDCFIGLSTEDKLNIYEEIGSIHSEEDRKQNECALHLLSCLHEIIGMGPCPKDWTIIYHIEELVRLCQNEDLKKKILATLSSMVKSEVGLTDRVYGFEKIRYINKFIHNKCGKTSK